jgi:hypothetical protein
MNFDICHKNELNSVLKKYYAGARKFGAVIDLTSDRLSIIWKTVTRNRNLDGIMNWTQKSAVVRKF